MGHLVTIDQKLNIMYGMVLEERPFSDPYIQTGRISKADGKDRIYISDKTPPSKKLKRINGVMKYIIEKGYFYFIKKVDNFLIGKEHDLEEPDIIYVLLKKYHCLLYNNASYLRRKTGNQNSYPIIKMKPGSYIDITLEDEEGGEFIKKIDYDEIHREIKP